MKRFHRLTPYFHLSSNPIFALETRHLARGGSLHSLTRSSRFTVLIACTLLLLVWLALMLVNSPFTRYSTSLEFALFAAGLSVLAGLALDFFSLSPALGSISGEIAAGRWELLRLTLLSGRQIVAAKHGVAQVRAWRWMMLIVAVRAATMLMIALTVLVAFLDDMNIFTGMPLSTFLIALCVSAGAGLIFALEPFLRMRAVTALGVAASARTRQPLSTVLVAIGMLAAFWLAQGFVAGALLLGGTFIISPLAAFELALTQNVIVAPLVFLVLCAVTVYGFYAIVQTWALRRAERLVTLRD